TSVNPFVVKLRFSDLHRIYKNYGHREKITYSVKGSLLFKAGALGDIKLPFTHRGAIPAIKVSLKIKNFKISKSRIVMRHGARKDLPGINLDDLVNQIGKKASKGQLRPVMDISFDLVIRNHTRARITFSNLKSTLIIGKRNVIKKGSMKILSSKNNVTIYRIKHTIDLLGSMKIILKNKKPAYTFKGSINVHLPEPFGTKPVKFNLKGKLRR
ncbi:MAG: hypothetical protein OEZ36_12745, partial [Spirochaetota bacterium]|nr:hypothetical protein [Spirochaetota bacterium]